MTDLRTLADYYYTSSDKPGEVYSTARRAFFADTDAAYLAWRQPDNQAPAAVGAESDIYTILASLYPAGLPSGAYSYGASRNSDANINLLVNADFRINRRGITSSSTSGAYMADMWKNGNSNGVSCLLPSYDLTTDTLTVPASLSSWEQKIERALWARGFAGETMTVSVEDLVYVSGSTTGLRITVGGQLVTLTPGAGVRAATFTVPAGATGDYLLFRINSGGQYKFRNLAIVRGSVPFTGTKRSLAEESRLCLRYYNAIRISAQGYAESGAQVRGVTTVLFPVEMAATPTVVHTNSSGNSSNLNTGAAPTVYRLDTRQYNVARQSAAAGTVTWTDDVTFDASP